MEKAKKENLKQVVKFALFSASAGLIQFLSFTALTEIPKMITGNQWPWAATYLPSLVLSVLWNFTFNRKFTFKSATNVPIAMLKVAIYYAIFTPVSLTLGNKAEAAGVNSYIIEIVTMLCNGITEFLVDKFIVFREPKKADNDADTDTKTE